MQFIRFTVRRLGFMRRVVGMILLVIGVLGLLMPILPGWPFLIPAIALLGRRDPLIRFSHMVVRRVLRWLRKNRHPQLRRLGMRLSNEYLRMSRIIGPSILAAERAFG